MARDARQAPYASVLSHPNVRSTLPPREQIRVTKIAQHGKLTPQQSTNLAKHIASIPHPVERLGLAQHVSEMGVLPTAALPSVLDAIHRVASTVDAFHPTNQLSSFPKLDTVALTQRAALDKIIAKQGHSVPPGATLSDYYHAIYAPKPAGWRGLYENLPRDAVMTPLYTAQGGFALGGAVDNAIQRGDTTDLKEIAAQQVEAIKHPGKFAQEHPFQALLAVAGGAKLAGRVGAVARNTGVAGLSPLEATPRSVPMLDANGDPMLPVQGEIPTVPRGTGAYSTRNLTDRAAQRVADAIVSRSKTAQGRALNRFARDAKSGAQAKANAEAAGPLRAFNEARKGVSRREAESVYENQARGMTPEAHAGYRSTSGPQQATPPEPFSNPPESAGFRYFTHELPGAEIRGTGTDYYTGAVPKEPRSFDAGYGYHIEVIEGGHLTTSLDDAARNLHVDKVEAHELYRNTPLAVELLNHAVSEAERRGYSITADFENPRLQAIADKVFARRGYTRELGGKTTTYRPPQPDIISRLAATSNPMTRGQAGLHEALTGMEDARVARLQQMGLLGDKAATRRAYLPAIKVAAKSGDADAKAFERLDTRVTEYRQEIGATTDEARKAQLQSKLADLDAEHTRLLNRLVQQHAASGAPRPVRVPEEQMRRVQSPFARQPGTGSGISSLKKSVKPTLNQGPYRARLFEAGTYKPITDEMVARNYLIPSRVEGAYRFANEVANPEHGMVKEVTVARGEQPFQIPDGYVAQIQHEAANPLADELEATTGAKPGHTPLQSLASTFKPEMRTVRPGQTVRLYPEPLYKTILEQGRGYNPAESRSGQLVEKAGTVLRSSLLYTRPAFAVRNTAQNMILNAIAAGTAPWDPAYLQALGRNREKFPVPPRVDDQGAAAVNFAAPGNSTLRNAWMDRGSTVGGVGRVALHPVAKLMQGVRGASVGMENWTRRAAYLRHAVPEATRLAHPDWNAFDRFTASFKPADAAVHEVLAHMARGDDAAATAAAKRAVVRVNDALGDYASMPHNKFVDLAVPFHRWTQFITQLMFRTLPLKYPGRTLLLYRLGALGQEAQHQMGPLKPSHQGAIPFGGGVLSTQSLNPLASPGQNFLPPQGETSPSLRRSLSNFSPFGQIIFSELAGEDPVSGAPLTNQYGDPIRGTDYLRLAVSQGVDLFPPARILAPLYGGGKTNAPATSANFPGLVQTGPARTGPQQPGPSILGNIWNALGPITYSPANLALEARQGDKKALSALRSAFLHHANASYVPIRDRMAKERGIDLTKPSPARTKLLLDAQAEWKKEQRR